MAFQGPLIVGNQESFTLGSFTTAQRDGLTGVAEGTLIYNNTEYKPQVYSNSAWGNLGGEIPTDLTLTTLTVSGITVGRGAGAISTNTVVGNSALQANIIGAQNTAVGNSALQANTTGLQNTANGSDSLYSNTTGSYNTASGFYALYSNTTGYSNTASGSHALYSNTTGIANNANGAHALRSNTTGYSNTAMGYKSLFSNVTGDNNVAIGSESLYYSGMEVTAGSFVPGFVYTIQTIGTTDYTLIGAANNIVGTTFYCTGVGTGTGTATSNTFGNIAIGYRTLFYNTTGYWNTAVGSSALRDNTTGYWNTAMGSSALYTNTTGIDNTAMGYWSLYRNTTGSYNTAIGFQVLRWSSTAHGNTAMGYSALYDNTTGYYNTAIGYEAGQGPAGPGNYPNISGYNNTFIGYQAVGQSTTASNSVTLGNSAITSLRCQVTTITSLSDERDKDDIINLDAGLEFINTLRPVSFTWNTRDGGKVGIKDAGFIAQELLSAQETTGITIPNLVSQENPDKLEAGYGTLIPVLVNAVQELTAMVKDLQDEIATLKGNN